jgi:hypothetical protein
MAKGPRKPGPGKASRAGRDMHDKNKEVRREAAEVLAMMTRKSKAPKKRK